MAAVAITGALGSAARSGDWGPFQDVSGNLWVIAFDSTPHLVAYESTNGGTSWPTTFATAATFGNFSLDCVYPGADVIYALAQDASHVFHIYSFTISTHTWAEVFTSGTRPTALQDASSFYPGFLVRRSTGEFVVFYNGPLHSTTFRSVDQNRCSSAGVWAAHAQVNPAVTINYSAKGAVLGASDRVHFLFVHSNGSCQHRSLDSSNTLDTQADAFSVGGQFAEGNFATIFYDSTVGLVAAANLLTAAGIAARTTSVANPSWADDTNPIGTRVTSTGLTLADDITGGLLYVFYRDVSTTDVFLNTCSGTTWGVTPVVQDVATAPLNVSAGLISVAGAAYMGVVFDDTGLWFDKLLLRAAAAGTSNTLALTGAGS